MFGVCGEDGNESKLKWLRKCRRTATQGCDAMRCGAMDGRTTERKGPDWDRDSREKQSGQNGKTKASIYRIKVFSAAYK